VGLIEREGVALQHGYMLEVVGEGARCRQTGYPGSDDDCLPTDQSRCH
jgi:hypothetical protein